MHGPTLEAGLAVKGNSKVKKSTHFQLYWEQ